MEQRPPIADPDAALVDRAQRGDQDAMRDLYRLHERRVYNLALRMTGNPWDAADATQDAFVKALTGLEHFRGNARFSTWIHRIAVNVVYDHLRRRRTEPLDDEALDRLAATPDEGPRQGRDPVRDGLSDDMKEALLSLEEGFRLAVVLCDLLGFSYGEAAAILEVQEGTVKSRLFRARAHLGRRLSPPVEDDRNPETSSDVRPKETPTETGA